MNVRIIKERGKWKAGQIVDVTRDFGNQLITEGFAKMHGDQTRQDKPPVEPKEETQPIIVNNYYVVEPNDKENE